MFASPNIAKFALTRRKALGLAGLAIAAPSLSFAKDAPAATHAIQGAGFYRRKVGGLEVAVVSDGTFPFAPPFPTFGANAGEEQVKAALERDFISYQNTLGHVNTLLVRSGKDVVLIDAGCGTNFGPTTGKVLGHLANAGVAPADVTAVVITHLHPDHVGGLLGPAGAGVFPNARFFIHKDEVAFWSSEKPDMSKSGVPEDARVGMVQAAKTVLAAIANRQTLLGDATNIATGVEAVAAPGHTPGHIALMIGSGDDRLFYITDAVHHYAIMMPNPEFYVAFDTDRDAAVTQRRAILERAASERLLVSGAHLPFPGMGHVRKNGNGYEWVPVAWEW